MASLTRSLGESGNPKQTIKVAIIDDDANYRSLMTSALDQSPELESVGSFSGGEEALKGIPSSASEVVLIDVRMPGMPGMECARQLRNVRPGLVIIMTSGFDHPDTLAKALEAGADAYLAKPFSIGRFLETLTVCSRYQKLGAKETHALPTFLFTPKKQTPEPTPITSCLLSQSGQFPDNAIESQRSTLDPKGGRMVDHPTTHKALWRMVITLAEDFHVREDLMQEALICFWLREQQYPGQHLNWYLRGVRFYLQHLRNSGCSLDSPRHSGARTEFARESGGRNEWLDTLRFDEGIMSEVTAHDLFSELLKWLRPIDQSILLALAEGLGPSEIAETLPISPQSVLRHRKKIADMAIKLGVVRLPVSPNPKARPH